jgi:uncharacterized protein (TIGR03083 family)
MDAAFPGGGRRRRAGRYRPVVTRDDHLAILRATGARLAEAADGALDVPVPSCPGWSMADLVFHVGEVHAFWRQLASGEITDPSGYVEPLRPMLASLVNWFRDGLDETTAVLGPLDPSTPMWTWSTQHDAGFVQRRMAHETVVHAWDALAARGEPEPIDAVVAIDGIDELLEHFLPARPEHLAGPAEVLRLHATDTGDDRVVRVGDGSHAVTRSVGSRSVGSRSVDATIAAPASDLLLLLWRRRPLDVLDVTGDHAAVARFVGRTSLD